MEHTFDAGSSASRENAARAEALLAQAKAVQARADQTQALADKQLAENRAKAAELNVAIAAAKKARADLDGRLAPLLAILHS